MQEGKGNKPKKDFRIDRKDSKDARDSKDKKDSKDRFKVEFGQGPKRENKGDFRKDSKRENKGDFRKDSKRESKVDFRNDSMRENKGDFRKDSKRENKGEFGKDTRSEFKRDSKNGTRIESKRDFKGEFGKGSRSDFKGESSKGAKNEFKRDPKNDSKLENKREFRRDNEKDFRKASSKATQCDVSKKCGGCSKIDVNYPDQLKEKQKFVDSLLSKYHKVEPIMGMKNPYHYRNKVHAVFDRDSRGNIISGVYEPGTHRVVLVENCLIEDQRADAIINTIRGMLKSFKIKTYDEDTGYGLFRHVLIRTGFKSGEIMVTIVLGSPILPSKNNFIKALLKAHPEITTIILNINNKKTSMVLGDKEQVIYGKGYIEDTLCGKVFRISSKSFYQVNPVQTEVLYNKAIELAGFTGKETIIDAYCGIGTIGIIASDSVKKVIGVELNKDAVRDANINTKRNEIKNVDIYNKDAGEFMSQMAANNETVDVVFMDPPRAGSDEKFLESLCVLKPKKMVYISCNPVTLERDLGVLVKKGYKVERVIPVDMFPGTEHVETVVLLKHM
jgi:23S rRNA (uracil1939-C5)-methyltransferase